MKGSMTVLALFILGAWLGHSGWIGADVISDNLSFWTLGIMIFGIGLGLGLERSLASIVKSLKWNVLVWPLATIVGTLVFSAVVSLILPWTVLDCLAVGSGVGYYSLSSILIMDAKSAVDPSGAVVLGSVALLSNILRELVTLVFAPFIVRYLGRHALVSVAGVTSIDVSLPVIKRYGGDGIIPVAIVSGITLEFLVPIMVTFFASI